MHYLPFLFLPATACLHFSFLLSLSSDNTSTLHIHSDDRHSGPSFLIFLSYIQLCHVTYSTISEKCDLSSQRIFAATVDMRISSVWLTNICKTCIWQANMLSYITGSVLRCFRLAGCLGLGLLGRVGQWQSLLLGSLYTCIIAFHLKFLNLNSGTLHCRMDPVTKKTGISHWTYRQWTCFNWIFLFHIFPF